ncbi:MAG: putative toxin-antitoxin system toxin component, PIN family [Ginsengibacter sp.]
MKIVLDTNILLQSIGHLSKYRPIWNAFLNEEFELNVTTSILLEYEEKLSEKTSRNVALNIVSLLTEASNARLITVYYEWNAIVSDYDDNKFFDAAIAGGVDYLVTNDAHFNLAKNLYFPKVNIVNAIQFLQLLSK